MSRAIASDRVAELGLDALCDEIADGTTMVALAAKIGVSFGTLSNWLSSDPERSARARAAREAAAKLWDEKAEQVLLDAADAVGVQRARELAQHYRWRASKIAPREYGDKLEVEHSGEIDVKAIPDGSLDARLRLLLQARPLLEMPTIEGDKSE